MDDAGRIVREVIVPALQRQDGFRGQLLLTQHATEKAISLNLWEKEEDLDAFEHSDLYLELMGRLADVLAGALTGERCEVSVQA